MKKHNLTMIISIVIVLCTNVIIAQTEKFIINQDEFVTNRNNYYYSSKYIEAIKYNIEIKMMDKLKIIRLDNSTIETKIDGNYLYAFPPYPLPAKNFVHFILYWDASLDINNAEMAVYDMNGNKICGKENITIDQQCAFNGIITWNSSGTKRGIYIIQIKHGTSTRIVKVIIE